MSRSQQRLWAFTSARLSRLWSSVKSLGRTEIDDEAERAEGQVAEAEDLALSAAGLRGGIAKIAQLRAYLQGAAALGPEAQLVLSRLWDHVPGEAPAAIRRVVEEDLGKPLAELYQSWDEVPLGAASLGQVHAAVGLDGQQLAVKVQYPGVGAGLRDDLASKGVLQQLVGGDLGAAISKDAIAALRERLLLELDYKAEAANLRLFASMLEGERCMVIPRVLSELSTTRVLTMERLTGRSLPSLITSGSDEARSAVARTIFLFAWKCPLRHGLVNVDPNPGNYLVLDENPDENGNAKVGFIDFGCTAELPEELKQADHDLWMAMIHRDGEALRHAAYRQGLIPSATSFNSSTYRAWEKLLGEPFVHRGKVQLTPEFVRQVGEVTWNLVHAGQLELPPHALLLWRQRLGVLAVLSSLRPNLDFRQLLAEVLDDHRHPLPLLQRYP